MKHVLNDVPNIVQCPGNGQGRQPSQHNTHHESDIFRFHQTGTYWTLTTCWQVRVEFHVGQDTNGMKFHNSFSTMMWILALILAVKFHEVSHGSHHSHHSHRLIRAMLQAPWQRYPQRRGQVVHVKAAGNGSLLGDQLRRATTSNLHHFCSDFLDFLDFLVFFFRFSQFFHISSKSLIVSALLLVKIW